MRFKEFLTEAGKVHVIKKPEIKPRGEPEVPARAFDREGKDRSTLTQMAKDEADFSLDKDGRNHTEWFKPDSDVWVPGGPYIEVGVKNKLNQKFVVTLPLKEKSLELDPSATFDVEGRNAESKKVAERLEKKILAFVLDALSKKGHGLDTSMDDNGHFDDGPLKGVQAYKRKHA